MVKIFVRQAIRWKRLSIFERSYRIVYCSVLSLSKKEKDGWKRDSRTVKSYKIFIHRCRELSVDVSCHDRWILPGQSRVNRVTSFDAFRLPTKRNSSNSEVVSPNFASNLCFQTEFEQVEYSNDVPPHTLIHTHLLWGEDLSIERVIRAEKAKRLAIREDLKTFLLSTSANEDRRNKYSRGEFSRSCNERKEEKRN